jgi:16S rRNA (cytidine1402-2'-O)-methyltransferase
MSGILYVVATPIGNLEDVTLRALRILREVAVIAAEDTRRTSRLLQHYSISTPTTSLHEHNERIRSAQLIRRLASGESVALVSDAGTPLISDPGAALVHAAHSAGIRVEPIPGPSALTAALSAAGFAGDLVHFAAFPPSKGTARRRWFVRLRELSGILVLYEAPHRIRDTLEAIIEAVGDRPCALARELTKAHEEFGVRPISDHLARLREPRGEYTLVVSLPDSANSKPEAPEDSQMLTEFGHMANRGGAGGRRETVRLLADKYGLRPADVYSRLERAKKSGD